MKLYELFNRIEVSINKDKFLCKAKEIYKQLTLVEKVMVDKRILINDDYPSYYWKLIASIYNIITGKDMERISEICFSDIGVIDKKTGNRRIRSKSESEDGFQPIILTHVTLNGINSLHDLYVNFIVGYKPFRNNKTDVKLNNLGYNTSIIHSVRDKMILHASNYSRMGKLHKVEIELMSHVQFVNCLNFMFFYESLTNFIPEQPLHISWNEINYVKMYNESDMFGSNLNLIFTKSKRDILFKILDTKYENVDLSIKNKNKFKAYNILKMISSDNYIIRIEDLYFIIDLCLYIFGAHSSKYISNILFICKLNRTPISLIILCCPFFIEEYNKIELTVEYMVSNLTSQFVKNYVYKFEVNEDNIESIFSHCKDFDMFEVIFNECKNRDLNVDILDMKGFIIKSIIIKEKNQENLISLIPTLEKELLNYKDEIISSYIEILEFELVKGIIDHFKDFNLYNDQISKAVGKSCSLQMLQQIYDIDNLSDELKKNIVIESCKRGSSIFLNFFTKLNIHTDEIILAISESTNTEMFSIYKFSMSLEIIEECIAKTIEMDNLVMFLFLWEINHDNINFYRLILLTCKYNRISILNLMLTTKKFELKFYLNIFNECSKYSNIAIMEKILKCIGNIVDVSLTFIQLTKLEKGISNILRSGDNHKILWLKDNLSINQLFRTTHISLSDKLSKKREILHKYGEDQYISSDDEEEKDDYLYNLSGLRIFTERSASF